MKSEQKRNEVIEYVQRLLRIRVDLEREGWVKGKAKMWDVFLYDIGLDNSVELALANMDLNDPVLDPVTFDDGDPLEGSSSTPTNVDLGMGREAEEEINEEESSADFVVSAMEEDYY